MSEKNQIAVVGLGVMGSALAKNFLSRGFSVALFNRTFATAKDIASQSEGKGFAYETLKDLVVSLEKPRKLFFMLPAGEVVDQHISELESLLEPGDIIMDGGNSFFEDSRRRSAHCEAKGISFFGVGVSGGEQGALLGPSIMPGGKKESYGAISPYLESISAKKDGEPCCAYIGEDGAGHFVKMVHNGIEYADMQLIAELYLYCKEVLHKSNGDIADILESWQETEVKSYLIEISATVLREKDPDSSGDLVDAIVDAASQKGTGKWTSIQSFELGVNVSMITASLQGRIVSNLSKEREKLGAYWKNTPKMKLDIPEITLEELRSAYYLAKVVAYVQGFAMMSEAAKVYHWNLHLENIASIFRAGCIIQAEFLEVIMKLYRSQPNLENLFLHPEMETLVSSSIGHLRHLQVSSVAVGLPTPSISASLLYLDQLGSPLLGANLIQGQRDYFGAHTFLRRDKEGVFHHEWNQS